MFHSYPKNLIRMMMSFLQLMIIILKETEEKFFQLKKRLKRLKNYSALLRITALTEYLLRMPQNLQLSAREHSVIGALFKMPGTTSMMLLTVIKKPKNISIKEKKRINRLKAFLLLIFKSMPMFQNLPKQTLKLRNGFGMK